MTSLHSVTYEELRWKPRGVRYASATLPKYGTYHPALPADIANLVLTLPPTVLADAEAASREITPFRYRAGR